MMRVCVGQAGKELLCARHVEKESGGEAGRGLRGLASGWEGERGQMRWGAMGARTVAE